MEDAKVENSRYNVIPVTDYDPFEAKFAASLYWLVFRATEDGEFENIPSQVTSPIQRDSEKRITVRPEVTEFLTKGEIYCQVCNSIFHGKAPVVGQWAVLQTLSRHGFYVVEEGDIAVTDSALQQKKPFRKSTHLALMDCLMSAFSAQAVSVPQVVQCVSKFSSFNASKELPFDLEDALLLWINKISAVLNENQLKKQKQHAEQLLQNQDKAKRFRFRRDQLQPKVQTVFPLMEELLKDVSDGKSLLGIIMFYHPTVINIEDVCLGKNLATEDCVHNLDLFRSLCSQFICTSVLALKVEDFLYGSQAMKPNIIALLAEIFQKCEVESVSENCVVSKQTFKSDADLQHITANKENVIDNKCSSAPVLNSDESKYTHGSPREFLKSKSERSSSLSGKLTGSALDAVKQENSVMWKSQSDGQVNSNSRLSFKSPFHLDFTDDYDGQQPPLNGSLPTQGVEKDNEKFNEKENPFTEILQRPVLAGETRKHSLPANMAVGYGSPRTTPRQEVQLLLRRNKQKQRTLDLEDWDMQQEEETEVVKELHLNDLQRSQSLTGLDKAKVEPRQSFHAWREDTGASLSDTNLASSRSERISLDFRPNLTTSVPQRSAEGGALQRDTRGTHVPMMSSKATREEHTSQDSLLSNPKSTDSLNMKPFGDQPTERQNSLPSGVSHTSVRDSCMSDISTKELKQFEEIEAMILAGRSVETPRRFGKPSKLPNASESQDDDDELNTSVSSEDMNKFRLEVMQRLTQDKLREIPDEPVIEMEDDDDPIMLARNNAASSPRNPTERTRLDVPDEPTEVPTDQLSPITETTEPCPSIASNPNSASNSTAPSSPCSPLDVAPFMPAFFTTSPANTLDRKMQRFSLKDRDNALVADDDEDDDFSGNPEPSATPRFNEMPANKNREFSSRSKSFEQLARGSYTVGHIPVETAKAAGIPVINASIEETRPRVNSNSELYGVLTSRKLNQTGTNASQNLSAFRPYVLSAREDEVGEIFATEGVDGRRDSLETSPVHSPVPALTRGKRDDTRQEAALRSRDLHALDSPGDVVIYERSLSSSHGTQENVPTENSKEQGNQNECAQTHSASVNRSKKAEAFVFDFDQGVVQSYEINPATQDYRTYNNSKRGSVGDGSNSIQGNQVLKRSQEDRFATFSRNSPRGAQLHRPQEQELASSRETNGGQVFKERTSVDMKDLRTSDGFSTYRKNYSPEKKANDANGVSGTGIESWDVRRSDGFSTFRKEPMAASADSTLAQNNMASFQGQRGNGIDPFSTFAKSSKRQESNQGRDQVELHHSPEQESTTAVVRGSVPSRGGESETDAIPREGEEEPVRSPGASNILRSRTFRKTPTGQIVEDVSIGTRNSLVHNELRSSTNSDRKDTGQHTVNKYIRDSPEGTGSDNPHRISWTDDQEAGARLIKQLNASKEMAATPKSHDSDSPRRRGSPRHTGRGSPGARISWLTAARSGVGGQVMLNDKGEIEEPEQDEAENEQAVTSQIAYLRMQLEEKRRHIEAEKHRAQAEWEDQRRRLGQTAFWYVIGKAQGGPGVGEGAEVKRPEMVPVTTPHSHETPRKPVPEFPNQPSPPVAWSSPANSPLPATALESSPPNNAGLETREFRLSDYPPVDNQGTSRPSSQPAVEVGSRPTPGPTRPASHEPAASRPSPTRKCWDVNVGPVLTPPPLVHPDAESESNDAKEESNNFGGTGEIEVEIHTPQKKGMAMFISDDDNLAPQGLTPEQQRKRERFMKARQKKQAEEKSRKEAELEKKRRREEKQREKEMLQRMEEERLRQEETERRKAEQELRLREAQAQPARIPDSYATFRRPGPQHVYDVNDDTSTYLAPAPSQLSGFAEFSGPQCYVKPSGKSNRKIIVNAISHVCLSGTVNQDQKEKCLQAISESDGHHFMILFKDGLKFRGMYVHNLENDQLFKIFGIGPRVITNKMIESLYKYNSGGKEFTKIPSKTLSISVDGFAIQKSCWNTSKPVVQSKTSSNLKRPPRPPQR